MKLFSKKSMGIYITQSGKEKSMRFYDSQMSKLDVPFSDLFVNTSRNISQWGRKTQRGDRARRYVNEHFQ